MNKITICCGIWIIIGSKYGMQHLSSHNLCTNTDIEGAKFFKEYMNPTKNTHHSPTNTSPTNNSPTNNSPTNQSTYGHIGKYTRGKSTIEQETG